jgi:hypothetical protein
MREITYAEAIREAMSQEMRRDERSFSWVRISVLRGRLRGLPGND